MAEMIASLIVAIAEFAKSNAIPLEDIERAIRQRLDTRSADAVWSDIVSARGPDDGGA